MSGPTEPGDGPLLSAQDNKVLVTSQATFPPDLGRGLLE